MQKKLLLIVLTSVLVSKLAAQFSDNGATISSSFGPTPVYRTGSVGVGYATLAQFNGALGGAGLSVFGQQISQVQQGTFGTFAAGNTWCGLGQGGPFTAPAFPYGLALARTGSVGFYNLIPGLNGEDLVAGFGSVGINANRFILRSYDNAAAPIQVSKDLLIANPAGSISLFREPAGTPADPNVSFYVDARQSNVPFQDIFIQNRNSTPFSGNLQTFSAIGKIGNANAQPFIAAEGFRSQISDGNLPPFNGVAVNLQTLSGPSNPVATDVAIAAGFAREAAELSWQDLDVANDLSRDCAILDPADAEKFDKFFISFRNNQNVNPFFAPNRLRVMTFQGNGRVGIGTDQPVSGCPAKPTLLDVRGFIASNGATVTSDRRFKQDIQDLTDAMGIVRQLQPTTYEFRKAEFPDRNFPDGRQFGFIAQDVEKILPEVAAPFEDGFYAMNYTMLIPVLTEAIKEQDQTIRKQEEVVTELRTEIAELRQQFNAFKAGEDGGLSDGFRLAQNAPNPFSQTAVIDYQLPAGTVGAKISVFDLTGRMIKTWSVSDISGQIVLNASEFNSGLYIYDLQINGRQILERKMTVTAKN